MKPVIYHNPRCSKSREALDLLRASGTEPTIIEYLKEPPDAATLRRLVQLLGISPRELLRTGEEEYRTEGLDRSDIDDETIIAAMVRHPRLIERPIVVIGDRATIGRPPKKVLELLP